MVRNPGLCAALGPQHGEESKAVYSNDVLASVQSFIHSFTPVPDTVVCTRQPQKRAAQFLLRGRGISMTATGQTPNGEVTVGSTVMEAGGTMTASCLASLLLPCPLGSILHATAEGIT